MARQKERFYRPNTEPGTYTLEKFRENERKMKAVSDKIFAITINDGTVSNELKERAKQLVAVEKALLDQAYVQAVQENTVFARRERIPGYKHRNKVYTVARAAGQISKALISGYLEGVSSSNRSPLDENIRDGAKKAGEWYRNKRQFRRH